MHKTRKRVSAEAVTENEWGWCMLCWQAAQEAVIWRGYVLFAWVLWLERLMSQRRLHW